MRKFYGKFVDLILILKQYDDICDQKSNKYNLIYTQLFIANV